MALKPDPHCHGQPLQLQHPLAIKTKAAEASSLAQSCPISPLNQQTGDDSLDAPGSR